MANVLQTNSWKKKKIKQFTNSEVWNGKMNICPYFNCSNKFKIVFSNDPGVNAVQETASSVDAHIEKVPSLTGKTVNEN